MKTFVPAYYPLFHCLMNRCRHSCCVGWEIDIDENTYQKYAALDADGADSGGCTEFKADERKSVKRRTE